MTFCCEGQWPLGLGMCHNVETFFRNHHKMGPCRHLWGSRVRLLRRWQ